MKGRRKRQRPSDEPRVLWLVAGSLLSLSSLLCLSVSVLRLHCCLCGATQGRRHVVLVVIIIVPVCVCVCVRVVMCVCAWKERRRRKRTKTQQRTGAKPIGCWVSSSHTTHQESVSLSMKFQASRFSASGRRMPLEPRRSEACRSCQPMHVLSFGEGRR